MREKTDRGDRIKAILAHLREKGGVDFSGYQFSVVERRISQQMSAVGCGGYGDYLYFLKEHPEEAKSLFEALTINVSRFFRDPLVFEYIGSILLPAVIEKKKSRKKGGVRIWSAGCAAGEEPYSIAILLKGLVKKLNFTGNINIFATDIDREALRSAERGLYTHESVENVKYGLLKEYFRKEDGAFKLNQEISGLIHFSVYNILDRKSYSPPESVFGEFDIVLCRNVLIYFQLEQQERVLEKLYRVLVPDGYLVLGETEALSGPHRRHFRSINNCCSIYQRR